MTLHAPIQAQEAVVRTFLTTLHDNAARAFKGAHEPGYLQIVAVHPADGSAIPSKFAIGDVDSMVRTSLDYAASGYNLYVEGRTVPKDVRGRGLASDTRGVFAFVVDSDQDKGMAGRVSAQPSLVVETSPGNRHFWYFLERALTADQAKSIGDVIRASSVADHDTGTITQPYRVAGTPNFPSAAKRNRGRVVVPTKILQQDNRLWAPDALRQAFPVQSSSQPRAGISCPPRSILGSLTVEPLVAERGEDRSVQFQRAVSAARSTGVTQDELEDLMRRYPQGCASKYLAGRDRLRVEIERSWGKAEEEESANWSGVPEPKVSLLEASPFAWVEDPTLIPKREWLYADHYIRRFVSVTVAPGGVGKSSLGIVEALAMASGKPLLGVRPSQRSRVWLWNGEDPLEEMQRRIVAAVKHYGLTREDIDGWLFTDSGRVKEIVVATQTSKGVTINAPVRDALIRTIRENRIDVVVIDPFVSSHQVTENDNNAIDRVAKLWGKIANETNCAIELVHHARKTGGGEISVEDGRGAVALLSAARCARVLNAMTDEEAKNAGVDNRRLHFRVDNGKANLAPPPEGSVWCKLASIDLGNGDSIGVVCPWTWTDHLEGISVSDLRAAQREVAAGRWRRDPQADAWVGRAIAKALRLNLETLNHKAKVKALLKIWMETGMFVVVDGKDDKGNKRKFVEVGEWATD